MLNFTRDWDIRLFWELLPLTAKGYLIFLFIAAAYTIYFLIRALFRLRRPPQSLPSSDKASMSLGMIELTNGAESIRQFHKLLLLLFGVVFTDEMFATLRGIRLYDLSVARMDIFLAPTAFAFVVFAVLIFLHIFQWAVAAKVQSRQAAHS